MTKSTPLPIRFLSASMLVFATMLLVSCQQSQPAGSAIAATPPPAPADKVFVVFEGPWAVATDPKDAGKILLIAPKTKSHHDLYVTASNNATLGAGIYDLSIPVSGTPGTTSMATDVAQAKTNAADLQHVLDSKSQRYVIRLPKPEAYLAAARFTSRVGPSYPPDPSTEKNYLTELSLRYSVSSFNGFSLSGTPDTGSFNPKLLQVEAGSVSFILNPVESFKPTEKCHVHSREAFRDLTRLLHVTLFIDFPDSPPSCRDTDPQKSKAAENLQPSPSEQFRAFFEINPAEVQYASMLPEFPGPYLFGHIPLICSGAVIFLN